MLMLVVLKAQPTLRIYQLRTTLVYTNVNLPLLSNCGFFTVLLFLIW